MGKPEISLEIRQHARVIKEMRVESKEEAKRLYYRYAESPNQYTQLIVNKRKYTTAQAERYFGKQNTSSRPAVLPGTYKKREK